MIRRESQNDVKRHQQSKPVFILTGQRKYQFRRFTAFSKTTLAANQEIHDQHSEKNWCILLSNFEKYLYIQYINAIR